MPRRLPPSVHAGIPSESTRPRIRRGAKALVSATERILLIQEQHADGREFWTLPGGGVRPGERLDEGLRRELVEEIQCDSVVEDVVSTFWYSHTSSERTASVYTVFACSVVSKVKPNQSEGILDAKWVAPDQLPPETILQVRHLVQGRDRLP